jgi:fluoride ion exporter CrcB/FEX
MAAPGQFGLAMLYIVASLVAGYAAIMFGIRAAKRTRAA